MILRISAFVLQFSIIFAYAVRSPEEANYPEGDILLSVSARNALTNTIFRWPDGKVPYVIGPKFNMKGMDVLNKTFTAYRIHTCIQFITRTNETNYVIFNDNQVGCASYVGIQGGGQEIELQYPECFKKQGFSIHEIMHALGFEHEQTRPERDNYVSVHFENIEKKALHNFHKRLTGHRGSYGVDYDYGSVMHYAEDAFTKNGNKTIVPKKEGVIIGQREGFSLGDVEKIRRAYNCTGKSRNNDL